MKLEKDLVLYVKVQDGCQLSCKHCYASSLGLKKSTIVDPIKSINLINQLKNHNIEASLHGGEPLLVPLNILKQIVEETKKVNPNIYWSATSNLVYPLTNELLDFIKTYFIQSDGECLILTSYDYGDIRFKNKDQEQLWSNNIRLLVKNNINVSCISTTTESLLNINPKDHIDYMISLGIKYINYERLCNTGRAKDNNLIIDYDKIDNFYLESIKYIEENNLPIKIRNIEEIKKTIKWKFRTGCRERKCNNRVITINANGTLSSCPNSANFKIFSTYNNDISSYINSNTRLSELQKESIVNNRCLACKYFDICGGECCQLDWTNRCPGLKRTMQYLIDKYGE